MKKITNVALSGALTLGLGAIAIFGNSLLASQAMAAGIQTEYQESSVPQSSLTIAQSQRTTVISADGEDNETISILHNDGSVSSFRHSLGVKRLDDTVEGEPEEGEISTEEATDIAISTLAEKYALKPEVMEKFHVAPEPRFFAVYKDGLTRVWWINLYPINTADFMQIGCYTAIIDAKTGEVLKTLTAADGVG